MFVQFSWRFAFAIGLEDVSKTVAMRLQLVGLFSSFAYKSKNNNDYNYISLFMSGETLLQRNEYKRCTLFPGRGQLVKKAMKQT